MRSNIACTCGSERVPLRASLIPALLQRSEERGELRESLRIALREPRVRRHWRRRVDQRARDRLARQARRDVREVRARPGVAVVADAVTAETARGRHHVLARLELWRDLKVDLCRWPGERALDGEERHG